MQGKRVLITGGSKGLGLACARAFMAERAQVALVSRTQAHLDAAQVALGEAFTWAADLRDPDAAGQMVNAVETRFGPIDIQVNSAGAGMALANALVALAGGLSNVADNSHRAIQRATLEHAQLHWRKILRFINHDVAVGFDFIGFFNDTTFARPGAKHVSSFVKQCHVGITELGSAQFCSPWAIQRLDLSV